jgi:cytochrome b6-f complex iron-sulfur subunit
MERVKIVLADDGQILVDKSVTYRIEKGDYDKPGAYLPYA